MSEDRKKHKLNKKIPFILSLVLTGVILCSFLFSLVRLVLEPVQSFAVENGNIYQEETVYGYIVRDEQVLKGENSKNGLIEIKPEGAKVSKGENVFRYYSSSEQDLKEKIAKLDIEIGEALEGQTDIYTADIQVLDKQIDGYLTRMLSTNNLSDIEEYKTNISDALIKKAKITGELSPSGSHINGLIEQRRKYEQELNNGQEYVKAEMGGVVSYRVDGLEEELKPENFINFNEKLLESYNLKTGQMIPTSSEAGKVVNNFECYIVTFLNSEEAHNATVRKGNND